MELERIERGWSVFSEDGKRVGDVVEVHPHYILVSRGLLVVRDVYVPRYAVGSVEERRVVLAIPDDRLRRMAWNTPPPEPPEPVDAPTPRLVPTAEEEEQDNPFAFGATTGEDDLTATAEDETTIDDDYAYTPDESEPEWDDYEDMGILFGSNVEIDGEVYLATQRLGDGPPIVFVHGWGCDRRIWDYLTLDLPNDYTVVTYDGRGYGRSTAPWVGYEVARMSHDLRVVLRTLDLTDATIVGLDLGAAAALHYALDGGRRVGRLILIAPTIPPDAVPVIPPVDDEDAGDDIDMDAVADADATEAGTDADATDTETETAEVEASAEMPGVATGAEATSTEAATIDAEAEAATVEAALEVANSGIEAETASVEAEAEAQANGVDPDTVSAPVDPYVDWRALLQHDRPRLASEVAAAWAPGASAETTAWLRDGFLSAAPYALAHGLDALDAPDLPGALSDLALPVTVLCLARDPFIPTDWARQLADAIPGSRLVELDTDGHVPMVLNPERLAQEIRTAMEQDTEASSQ